MERTNVALVALSLVSTSICVAELFFVRSLAAGIGSERADTLTAEVTALQARIAHLEANVHHEAERAAHDNGTAPALSMPPVNATNLPAAPPAPVQRQEWRSPRGIAAPMPSSASAPSSAPSQAPASAAVSFLNINSIPPSVCFIDGERIGPTPQAHVAVAPGTHAVRFMNTDTGLARTISVSAAAGETKAAVVQLTPASPDGF